jgi:hypothetical protein
VCCHARAVLPALTRALLGARTPHHPHPPHTPATPRPHTRSHTHALAHTLTHTPSHTRSKLHVYSWRERALRQTIDLGPDGAIPLETRFAHDPAATWAYVVRRACVCARFGGRGGGGACASCWLAAAALQHARTHAHTHTHVRAGTCPSPPRHRHHHCAELTLCPCWLLHACHMVVAALCCAVLCCCVLRCVVLRCAVLRCAALVGANRRAARCPATWC